MRWTLALLIVLSPVQAQRAPDIYFVPTTHAVADAMLRLAHVTPDDVVYDLGSGDGRIVIIAAQKYGARGVGVELDARLVELSRQTAQVAGVADRVRFIQGDLFTADLSEATVVTLYLSRSVNMELEPKLREELRPGARIVSHQFRIGRWAPEQTIRVDGEDVFLWTVSGGKWGQTPFPSESHRKWGLTPFPVVRPADGGGGSPPGRGWSVGPDS